jgi:hypothetical protein
MRTGNAALVNDGQQGPGWFGRRFRKDQDRPFDRNRRRYSVPVSIPIGKSQGDGIVFVADRSRTTLTQRLPGSGSTIDLWFSSYTLHAPECRSMTRRFQALVKPRSTGRDVVVVTTRKAFWRRGDAALLALK